MKDIRFGFSSSHYKNVKQSEVVRLDYSINISYSVTLTRHSNCDIVLVIQWVYVYES